MTETQGLTARESELLVALLRREGHHSGAWFTEHLLTAAAHIEALEARLEAAREALKPFAEAAGSYDPDEGDDRDVAWSHDFTIGSVRRARETYRTLGGEP